MIQNNDDLRVTVTSKEQTAVFPDPSVNVYVTVIIVPTTKGEFGARVLVTAGVIPELSVARGSVHETEAKSAPLEATSCISLGHPIITGGVLSTALAKMNNNKTMF